MNQNTYAYASYIFIQHLYIVKNSIIYQDVNIMINFIIVVKINVKYFFFKQDRIHSTLRFDQYVYVIYRPRV